MQIANQKQSTTQSKPQAAKKPEAASTRKQHGIALRTSVEAGNECEGKIGKWYRVENVLTGATDGELMMFCHTG